MESTYIFGAVLALASAIFYGGADIFGGLASRRNTAFQALAAASLVSIFMQAILVLIGRETIPSTTSLVWASLSGVSGGLGLVVLYKGLATGKAAIVSPISGVVSAAIPVAAAALTQGAPTLLQAAGFALALGGIWMVTQSAGTDHKETRDGVLFGFLSGLFFGMFFILVARIEKGPVFFPLMVSKIATFLTMIIFLIITKMPVPSLRKNPAAVISGVLDPLANALYLVSTHFTRLDVAAVLSSLYPAVTVLLSLALFKERVSRVQWSGVALCVAAIILIIL